MLVNPNSPPQDPRNEPDPKQSAAELYCSWKPAVQASRGQAVLARHPMTAGWPGGLSPRGPSVQHPSLGAPSATRPHHPALLHGHGGWERSLAVPAGRHRVPPGLPHMGTRPRCAHRHHGARDPPKGIPPGAVPGWTPSAEDGAGAGTLWLGAEFGGLGAFGRGREGAGGRMGLGSAAGSVTPPRSCSGRGCAHGAQPGSRAPPAGGCCHPTGARGSPWRAARSRGRCSRCSWA